MSQAEIVQKVIEFIEESIRSDSRKTVQYIDLKNQQSRIKTLQNHVVFGRRGAGKSSLLSVFSYKTEQRRTGFMIGLNMEDFKDIPFPNIVIHVLHELLVSLDFKKYKMSVWTWERFLSRKSLIKEVQTQLTNLKTQLGEPLTYEITERKKGMYEESTKAGASASLAHASIGAEYAATQGQEVETHRTVQRDKLGSIRDNLTTFKGLLRRYGELYKLEYIYLVLDDFYFIPRAIQSRFIDIMHRLTKDTPLYLKIASIKFRSRLYETIDGTYVGVELNHDIVPIDLDYTLEDFNSLKKFMQSILKQIFDKFSADFISNYFAGDGFEQLCLASGGVPRDFLNLLARLLNKYISKDINRIGKIEVTEVAIELIHEKISTMKSDSMDECDELEKVLNLIKGEILNTKKCNVFLVSKEDIATFPREYSYIKELMDLRLLHLVDSNTSCAPSDGKRYEAYMVDIGLYPNSRQQNFKQVNLGYTDDKSRNDPLRSSPKLSLQRVKSQIDEGSVIEELLDG